MVIASELKSGVVLRIEGQIYKVLEVEVKAGAAKLSGVVKAKLRNLATGRMWEHHFRLSERLQELQLEQQRMEFLFAENDTATFMDPRTFEQVEVRSEILGPGLQFLQSGMQVPMEFFEGQPITIVLPDILEARVATTAPALHAQQDSAWKEAILENGLSIRVPLFIAPGEMVRVEVNTGRYVERVRAERRHTA